ncbi:MAG: hypothetical protein Q9214_000497, partial [Letrouitia sp. 1 TL-2023]
MEDSSSSVLPAAVIIALFALISILIDVPPIIWHIKNRNVAASSLIAWILFSNFCNFVNALIWPNLDVFNWWNGYIFCDIQVKLMVASWFGVTGSLVCITRDLALVLDTEKITLVPTRQQRWKRIIITTFLCFGFPIYAMLAHYIVQSNRYFITAVAGCTPSFYDTWIAIPLVFVWPPVLCFAGAYYADVPSDPYDWQEIHGQAWNDVILVPLYGAINFDRWIQITFGYVIFFFFGLGSDAMKMYRKWLLKCGLGRLYPRLNNQSSEPQSPSKSGSDHSGSTFDFWKRFSAKNMSWSTLSKFSITSSPTDPEMSFHVLSTIPENENGPAFSAPISVPATPIPRVFTKPRTFFSNAVTRDHHPTPAVDIEAALEASEQHRPNRFLAGLWHANQGVNR